MDTCEASIAFFVKAQPHARSTATAIPGSWYVFPILAILAVYFPLLTYKEFIEIDDGGQIFENPNVLSLSWSNIRIIFTTSVIDMYQPLTSLLFAILVYFSNNMYGSLYPPVFRATCMTLHAINTSVLLSIANTILQNPHQAFYLALFFAIHPIHVETVAWISACSTLLSTTGFLWSLYYYLQWNNRSYPNDLNCTRNPYFYWMSVLWYGLGGLAKVTMVPLVGILLVWEILFVLLHPEEEGKEHNRKARKLSSLVITKIPFWIMACTLVRIAYHFRGGKDGFPGYDYDPIWILPAQLLWYPTKFVCPIHLGILYDWPSTPWTLLNLCGYGIILVVVGGSIAMVLLLRQRQIGLLRSVVTFGVIWYLAMITLHTTLVTKFLAPYADRYAYVSCMGLVLALLGCMTPQQFTKYSRWMMMLIALYGMLAHRQVYTWKNTMSVWSQNLLHENASFSFGMRGAIHYQTGNREDALRDFRKAAESPDTRLDHAKYAYLFNALGVMTADHDPQKALDYFLRVLQFDPSSGAFLNLAKMLLRMERYAETERILMEVFERDEASRMTVLDLLTNLYFQSQHLERIPTTLQLMIQLDPHNALLYQKRAFILQRLGDVEASKIDLAHANELLSKQK
jgi:Tfp pilus assembly protein PilF